MNYLLSGAETERLKFRLLQHSDYDEWMPLFADRNTAVFLGMGHLATAKEQCDLWFEKSMARYANNKGGMNVLLDKQNGKLIGQCGLLIQEVEGETILEIGYSILPQYWGKGFATEAAQKCKEEAFMKQYSEELYSIIHMENIASMKVAENNGMKRYKSLPDYKGMPVYLYRISSGDLE